MKTRWLVLPLLVLFLAACGQASKAVSFFNDTVNWTYACLPLGQVFRVTGDWEDRQVFPNQIFLASIEENDIFNRPQLRFTGDVGMSMPPEIVVGTIPQLEDFRLVGIYKSRMSPPVRMGSIPAFRFWDHNDQYALIAIFPGFQVDIAEPAANCASIVPPAYHRFFD